MLCSYPSLFHYINILQRAITQLLHQAASPPAPPLRCLVDEVLCAIFIPICLNADLFW